MSADQSLFRFFSLPLPCTEEALKSAYRAAARCLHPDVAGDHEQFIALTNEYNRLRANPATFSVPLSAARTTDGALLGTLGLGLGALVNGRECVACKSKGYVTVTDVKEYRCPNRPAPRFSWYSFCPSSCSVCHGASVYLSPTIRHERCWECKGAGEIIVFNPVIPKGQLRV